MHEPSFKTWTPARLYMLASTLFLLPAGVIGLAVNRNFAVGEGATDPPTTDMVFGILETNGWHSTLALINGIAALALMMLASDRIVRHGALHMGIGLAVFTVALMVPTSIHLLDNIVASNFADNVTHAMQAIGGIGAWWLSGRPQTTSRTLATEVAA